MKYFYSHLVEIETLTEKLDELEMNMEQKKHLAILIDSTIHQEILDIIFSRLSEEDKLLFIKNFNENPEDPEIMKFLNDKTGDIEKEIKEAIKKIKLELHEDIKTAKRGRID